MCIIAAKPAGIAMPDRETLETMWYANPDGAGLMYPRTARRKGWDRTAVQIEKGFMKLSDLTARLDELARELDLTALPVVLHFRITTHGGTCPENCHPFPVSDSPGILKKRKTTTRLGVAHNGIITSVRPRKGFSDTMEYIASQLAPLHAALPRFWENKHALRLVENAIESKMAFLTPEGKIITVGHFEQSGGIQYSNSSYQPWTQDPRYAWSCSGGWAVKSFRGLDEAPAPSPRPLLLLSDVPGAYGLATNGELLDGEDLALAADGMAYWYDFDLDGWVECPGVRLRSPADVALRFNEDLAVVEETYTEDDAQTLYGILYDGIQEARQ